VTVVTVVENRALKKMGVRARNQQKDGENCIMRSFMNL
jgi:hypothetical protein